MWIEWNGQDIESTLTSVDPESIDLKSATTDPLSTLSFEYYDIGSQNPLNIGDFITVWDETGASSRIAQPTRNLLINTLLFSTGVNTVPNTWTLNNALATSPLTYDISGGFGMKAAFSNTTYTGGNNYAVLYQDAGNTYFQKVYPGQTYYVTIGTYGTGTISNIQSIIQIQFTDVSHNVLGSATTTYTTPISGTQQIISVSQTAPASAVYARVSIGARATTSGANSGNIWFGEAVYAGGGPGGYSGITCEPALFVGRNMADGTPISYPSPECATVRTDCTFMPDQTTVRTRFLFNGYIKDLKADYDGTNRHYEVDCLPLGDVIDNGALVTGVYPSVAVPTPTDQGIINDLVTTYFSTSLYTGQSNIFEPSTTVQFGQAISSVSFVDETMRDMLNTLSDSTGFIYFVDEYNYLWYNDTPFNYSTIGINVENADYITQFPPENYIAEQDGSQLANSVKVLGGQFYTIETDVFSGTGSTTSFPLASKPQNISNVTIGSTLYAPTSSNKVGVNGQDVLNVGGIQVLYDPNSSNVSFHTAPASGTNNVFITYPTYRNVSVLVEDNQSVAKYGRHFCSKVTDTSITDSATAQTRGIAEISKYSEPIDILTFDLTSSGSATSLYIPRGYTTIVNSALDGFVNQPFTVTEVEIKSKGAGVNVYSYTCGIYRPSMTDSMRHTATALQADTANGSTTIQLTIEMLQENLFYSESISSTPGGTGPYKYDNTSTKWGYSVYS
jgi:hypothetical protein